MGRMVQDLMKIGLNFCHPEEAGNLSVHMAAKCCFRPFGYVKKSKE